MLIEFSVENYYSIKEKVTFSMVASKDKSHEDNLILDSIKNINLLKTSAIYGANGSGKTTILNALNFISFLLNISNNMQRGKRIPIEPFKLERKYKNSPSIFDIIFKVNNIKYAYGFAVTEKEVVEEYLYYYPNGRQTIIFQRDNINQYKFTNDIERQTQIKDKFHSDNKLFLSTLSAWDYEKAQVPYEWLANEIYFVKPQSSVHDYTTDIIKDDKYIKSIVISLLNKAIIGIDNIELKEIEIDPHDNPLLKFFNEEAMNKILSSKDNKLISVSTIHKMNDCEDTIEFDLSDESDGTQKLYGLLGMWVSRLEDGGTLVVDELDLRLHSKLTRFLVELFQDPTVNKNNAQLIFTTHDTNLLDQDLFRRDQIWFTEKKSDDSTDLYSLDDFNVRKDAAIEKGYLQGKYGAIPYLKADNLW
ncbi:AAA family ATPase [uncultured Clostridium sp.]|uniref:AAA family ATPase n=1 Tax=uncultured Clostridium sp. TaxID=59620 RepID=UPI0025DEDFDC|nr:AAA family ATPase [uncultured Clostridium sp.]